MGQNWPYRKADVNDAGGNGGKPDKGTGASPRGRDYHPGRSCQTEAVVITAGVVLAARVITAVARALAGRR